MDKNLAYDLYRNSGAGSNPAGAKNKEATHDKNSSNRRQRPQPD